MTSTPESASDPDGPHAGPDEGQVKTIAELFADWYARQASYARGAGHDGPGADWRMIRAAEASAGGSACAPASRTRPPPDPGIRRRPRAVGRRARDRPRQRQ